MATLSRDGKTSWRAHSVVHKDNRHTHAGPEVTTAVGPTKKDTRKWCRGHVGRSHDFEVAVSLREVFPRLIAFCPTCGKEFGHYWGSTGPFRQEVPTWATAEKLRALEAAKHEREARRKRELEAK